VAVVYLERLEVYEVEGLLKSYNIYFFGYFYPIIVEKSIFGKN